MSTNIVKRFMLFFVVCLVLSLFPASAVNMNDIADIDADDIISQLQRLGMNVNKVQVDASDLTIGTIVQLKNSTGYIRYLVYWGVDPNDPNLVILLSDNYKYMERIPLRKLQEEYTGNTIQTNFTTSFKTVEAEILKIKYSKANYKLQIMNSHKKEIEGKITKLHIIKVVRWFIFILWFIPFENELPILNYQLEEANTQCKIAQEEVNTILTYQGKK